MRTKQELSAELGISLATVNNWIKTGLIPASSTSGYYDQDAFEKIILDLSTNSDKLKSRVNRSRNTSDTLRSSVIGKGEGQDILRVLSEWYQQANSTLSEFMFAACVGALEQKRLVEFVGGEILCEGNTFQKFLHDWQQELNLSIVGKLIHQFKTISFPDNEVDFLGSLYETLRTVNDKAKFGAFFTPPHLISDCIVAPNQTMLDPCAGTGTLILGLISKAHDPAHITLRDVDALALKIARVNFVLFFHSTKALVQIEQRNIIFDRYSEKQNEIFDCVITNPPYGARLSEAEKKFAIENYPELNSTETFSIALFNSLEKLAPNGKLIFILPESFLYIDVHLQIRKLLFTAGLTCAVHYFGNAFKGVMSKIIRLDVTKGNGTNALLLKTGKLDWLVPETMLVQNDYRPPLIESIEEVEILEKILSAKTVTLNNRCKFGLGVVTGNNALHLTEEKSSATAEPIFTGKEIKKFKFDTPNYFIELHPENLQQVAPITLYRQPKICYRFISDSIVTVADLDGHLILNSANFLIPDSTISIKALSAFLNTPIVTFVYRRLFNAAKVLRNHLEFFPIPVSFPTHVPTLEQFYNRAAADEDVLEELNRFVGNLFGLCEEQCRTVYQNTENKNVDCNCH